MSDVDRRRQILAAAREMYARTAWSHKIQEKEREIWGGKKRRMDYINLGLVASTTLFAVVSVALQPKWLLVLTALFASATTAFVLWQSSFDPASSETQHRAAAKELLCEREQLMILISHCYGDDFDPHALEHTLETITRELSTIHKFAPDTSPEAYKLASSALNAGELTFSDSEIDALLPSSLRKKQRVASGD
jgi:hypothetical protein